MPDVDGEPEFGAPGLEALEHVAVKGPHGSDVEKRNAFAMSFRGYPPQYG
jgi:hypothetical protein